MKLSSLDGFGLKLIVFFTRRDVRAQVEDEEVGIMKLIGPDDWV